METEEKQENVFTDLYVQATDYVDLQSRSFKLEIYERITNLITTGISAALIILFSVFCYMFLNVGLAIWLGDVFDSYALGFISVGGFNMALMILYLIFDKVIVINRAQDTIFHKLSKTNLSYDDMMLEQERVHQEIDVTAKKIEDSIENIKSKFMLGKHPEIKLSRLVLAKSAFYISKLIFRNSGPIQKFVYPWIVDKVANTLVINESSIKGFVSDLKNKIRGKKPVEKTSVEKTDTLNVMDEVIERKEMKGENVKTEAVKIKK